MFAKWVETRKHKERIMNEVQRFNLRQAGEWLSGEVEIRVPKKWLAVAAVALGVLLLVALD